MAFFVLIPQESELDLWRFKMNLAFSILIKLILNRNLFLDV
jgi:hypothetical protein